MHSRVKRVSRRRSGVFELPCQIVRESIGSLQFDRNWFLVLRLILRNSRVIPVRLERFVEIVINMGSNHKLWSDVAHKSVQVAILSCLN